MIHKSCSYSGDLQEEEKLKRKAGGGERKGKTREKIFIANPLWKPALETQMISDDQVR